MFEARGNSVSELFSRLTMAALLTLAATSAHAEEAQPQLRAHAPTEAPPPPPPAYVAPWMMRPLLPGNSVRVDNSVGLYDDHGKSGVSNVTLISGGYRAWRNLQISFKTGFVGNQPNSGTGAFAFLNGVVGALYSFQLPLGFYATPSFGVSLPWGMGGGDNPDANVTAAIKSGGLNRQVLEGSVFGVNFLALNPGATLGWLGHGFTVQADAQLFESFRVRASDATDPDHTKTNLWTAVHAGYLIIPQLSVSTELHYQRYLTDVTAVRKDPMARDALSMSAGLRTYFKRGRASFKPGVSYTRTFIGQGEAKDYNVIQVDMAVAIR